MTVQELIDALRRFPPDMLILTENNCADDGISLFDPHPMLRTVGRFRGIFADGPDYAVEEVRDPGQRQHALALTPDCDLTEGGLGSEEHPYYRESRVDLYKDSVGYVLYLSGSSYA